MEKTMRYIAYVLPFVAAIGVILASILGATEPSGELEQPSSLAPASSETLTDAHLVEAQRMAQNSAAIAALLKDHSSTIARVQQYEALSEDYERLSAELGTDDAAATGHAIAAIRPTSVPSHHVTGSAALHGEAESTQDRAPASVPQPPDEVAGSGSPGGVALEGASQGSTEGATETSGRSPHLAGGDASADATSKDDRSERGLRQFISDLHSDLGSKRFIALGVSILILPFAILVFVFAKEERSWAMASITTVVGFWLGTS